MTTIETTAPQPQSQFERCETCDAPVDREQRYCVSCGTRRRTVADPAARYLATASARARASRAKSRTAVGRRGRQGPPSIVTALILAVIPVAVAVGVLIGHSGSNDKQLIQAVRSAHSDVTVKDVGGAGTSGATGTSGTAKSHSKKHHGSSAKGASSKNGGTVVTRTKYGAGTKIPTHVTKSQEQQGASATKKVSQSKGTSYVHGQSGLPGTVVVP